MKSIKIKTTKTYNFVKDGNCESCDLFDYCNEIDDTDCEGGADGHYECDDEDVEQINDLQNGNKR